MTHHTTRLEIFAIYQSREGREISFYDVARGEDMMDIEDYGPSNFWSCFGGISICINQYQNVFYATRFYVLVKATSFLIHTLYWLKNEKSDWFDDDDEYPMDAVVRFNNHEILKLSHKSNEQLSLSFFTTKGNYVRQRGDRYFEEIQIHKDDWREATELALAEYFNLLLQVINNDPDSDTNKTMLKYYEVYRNAIARQA